MKKLLERLLIFFVGIPLFAALVLLLPYRNHLALNLVVILLSALASMECADMLNRKGLSIHRMEALVLGAVCPAAQTAATCFLPDLSPGLGVCLVAFSWLLASRVFVPGGKLEDGLNRIAAGITVISYPGLFLLPVIMMGALDHARAVILVFLIIVFGNDSFAWAAGMLFGKNNRGIIPASPNKSAAGYIAGFAASLAAGLLAAVLVPDAFRGRFLPPLPAGAVLGLFSGAAASLGDLIESVMKRSAGVKDSGNIVPGRGGVLDSIDSVAFTAPIYYGLYNLLFLP